MAERGISALELVQLLEHPQQSVPSAMTGDVRYLTGYGILAVVQPEEQVVITVGIDGANNADWMTRSVERAREMDSVELTALDKIVDRDTSEDRGVYRRQRLVRKVAPGKVTVTNVLDGVAPALHSDVLYLCDGDLRRITIDSPTRVIIETD